MKRLSKTTGSCLVRLIVLILVMVLGYFLGTHKDEVYETIDKYKPAVTEKVQPVIEKVKELTGPEKDEKAPKTAEIQPPAAEPGQNDIKVCSFNIRVFSNNSRDDSELTQVANILKYCDITAIQELRDEEVLKRTEAVLQSMGYDYDYEISPAVGRGVKERYAFLYKKGCLSPISAGKLYEDSNDEFIREPFYATFKAGNFDFILLTIHVLYGDSENERRPELVSLAKVFDTVSRENPTEHDIILLGDFNFPPDDVGWDNLKSFPSMTYLIKPPEKTTITDTSLYDNIWFQADYAKEYTGLSGIIKFDENMFGNDDNKAKLAVSDHRPIWARFRTDMKDDD